MVGKAWWSRQDEKRQADWGPRITFKGKLPVKYFLQPSPVSQSFYNLPKYCHQLGTNVQNMSLWGTFPVETVMIRNL
jgi:hypothetical protein